MTALHTAAGPKVWAATPSPTLPGKIPRGLPLACVVGGLAPACCVSTMNLLASGDRKGVPNRARWPGSERLASQACTPSLPAAASLSPHYVGPPHPTSNVLAAAAMVGTRSRRRVSCCCQLCAGIATRTSTTHRTAVVQLLYRPYCCTGRRTAVATSFHQHPCAAAQQAVRAHALAAACFVACRSHSAAGCAC
eukprot:COSAG01_NODE_582_length_15201_cov_7.218315_1_plen_193_part_00